METLLALLEGVLGIPTQNFSGSWINGNPGLRCNATPSSNQLKTSPEVELMETCHNTIRDGVGSSQNFSGSWINGNKYLDAHHRSHSLKLKTSPEVELMETREKLPAVGRVYDPQNFSGSWINGNGLEGEPRVGDSNTQNFSGSWINGNPSPSRPRVSTDSQNFSGSWINGNL